MQAIPEKTYIHGPPATAETDRPPPAIFNSTFGTLDESVPLAEAFRLLIDTEANVRKRSFSVLSPTDNGGFRRREADALDRSSMIDALRLPPDSHFMALE